MKRRFAFLNQLASDSTASNYAVAVLAAMAAHIGHWPLSLFMEPTRFLLSFPAVFFASWLGGVGPGFVAIVICGTGAAINFFLLDTRHEISSGVFLGRLFLFSLLSVFIVVLNGLSLNARKRIEKKRLLLEESEARLRLALKGGRASLWKWNIASGRFWRSEDHDVLFGLPKNEAGEGEATFLELVHADDRKKVESRVAEALDGQTSYVVEYRVVWPDGSVHWLHTSAEVARVGENAVSLSGSTVDVTERKALEIELGAAKEVAERSSRAKTDFVSHMSHELRTPLGVIIGFTDLALESSAPGSEQNEYLVRVRKSGETLLELIGNILDLAKVEANKLIIDRTDLSLASLMKDLVADVSLQAKEKNLEMKYEIAPDVPGVINTDLTRLRQILMNLVGNAIKFTEKGSVTIKVRWSNDSPRCLEFSVKDTGIGLTEEQSQRLFQAFTQADPSTTRKYGGTGLGLTLSRQLARLLGGDLRIEESQPQQGTTFVFSVDAGDARPVAVAPKAPAVAKGSRDLEGFRILLVEDSPDNRLLVTRFLTLAGASVTQAENGQEGVDQATSNEYDVILMDIQMPVLDGFSAIREMRRREVGTPVIALTAHALIEERQRAFEAGFDDYVTKPISRDVLIQAVKVFAPAPAPAPVPSARDSDLHP